MPKEDTQFKKGNKYGGRKKGSKNKISKVALNAIYRDLTDNAGDSIGQRQLKLSGNDN